MTTAASCLSTAVPATGDEPSHEVAVLVIMGVSGCGKSTVAGMLAGSLGWALEEGDDLHPPSNIAKMAAGQPLDDTDRLPWLQRVAGWIENQLAQGRPGVITCSALKRNYRDLLRRPGVVFVHLTGGPEMLRRRLEARLDHFMPTWLLDSQLHTLEPPDPDEAALTVQAAAKPALLVEEIMRRLPRAC